MSDFGDEDDLQRKAEQAFKKAKGRSQSQRSFSQRDDQRKEYERRENQLRREDERRKEYERREYERRREEYQRHEIMQKAFVKEYIQTKPQMTIEQFLEAKFAEAAKREKQKQAKDKSEKELQMKFSKLIGRQIGKDQLQPKVYQKVGNLTPITYGQFSKFANSVESELNSYNILVQQVIQEACLSYNMKFKENYNQIQKMTNLGQLNEKAPFVTQQQALSFIENQVSYFMENYDMGQMKDFPKKYYQCKIYTKNTSIVEGRIIQAAKISFADRYYGDKNIYLKTDTQNLFIKLSGFSDPVQVILKNGKFLEKKDFMIDSQKAKEEILTMVTLFLENKGYILTEEQVKNMRMIINNNYKT